MTSPIQSFKIFLAPKEAPLIHTTVEKAYRLSKDTFIKAHFVASFALLGAVVLSLVSTPLFLLGSAKNFLEGVVNLGKGNEFSKSKINIVAFAQIFALALLGTLIVLGGFFAPGKLFEVFKPEDVSIATSDDKSKKEIETLKETEKSLRSEIQSLKEAAKKSSVLDKIAVLKEKVAKLEGYGKRTDILGDVKKAKLPDIEKRFIEEVTLITTYLEHLEEQFKISKKHPTDGKGILTTLRKKRSE